MREVEDSEIELIYQGKEVVSAKVQQPTKSVEPIKSVEVVERYSVADVQANPNKIYVFGDNTQRVGMGGQAQIRNNSNSMGIATKISPSMDEAAFMSDKDLVKNKQIIDGDIAKIKAIGKIVVMPKDGLGTGLAQLKERAPQTYAYLKQRLLQEFGFDNDNGSVNNKSQTSAPVVETPQVRSTKERVLKDGKSYNLSDIGIDMLIKLGYSNDEVGQILKEVIKEIKSSETSSEKPGLISGSASNIFNEILQAHYGEFIFKSSEYYKKHGLSAPAIYSTPFSDSINSIIKNNKEFNLTGAQPIFTRIASIFENRIANGKTGMEETINFINTRLNTNIKVDISKYENLAKQSLKSDNDIMINVMSNTKLSTQEKLDKTKANTDLQNQRIVAAVDIVNDIFSQIDKSIPKLSTRPALGANQAVADYTKEDQVKILIVNMKARPENTKDVLKKYGLTIDTFSKNFEKYYTESLQAVNQKPESVSQEEWDALSQEEKNKINEC